MKKFASLVETIDDLRRRGFTNDYSVYANPVSTELLAKLQVKHDSI